MRFQTTGITVPSIQLWYFPEKVDKNPRIYHYLPLYKGMEKFEDSKKMK